ncbi:MAG: hypothetical protein VX438_11580, partial [Planctomycetota bacterium]|nr:hypothetical protein [Planctomycetota bacterium]
MTAVRPRIHFGEQALPAKRRVTTNNTPALKGGGGKITGRYWNTDGLGHHPADLNRHTTVNRIRDTDRVAI